MISSRGKQPQIHLPVTAESDRLKRIRHTASHIMAMAVQKLFPETQVTIGPWTDYGFYYDFYRKESFTENDLETIQDEMVKIIDLKLPVVREVVSREQAQNRIKEINEPYKLEILDGINEDTITIYHLGDKWWDLCSGPHLENTGDLDAKAFELESVAGAYWRGDSTKAQLQRIYGTAWETAEQLSEYKRRKEEAIKRDHRKLGRELHLFVSDGFIGSGLPLWLPNGAIIRRQLEEFIKELKRKAGYKHVYTPALAKKELYQISGHWQHYEEDMFPVMKVGNDELVLRPMNCPHHIIVYKSKLQSYRDLPVKIAELGTMYRSEMSGVLSGLTRVRTMTLNDAHIFCTPDQVKEEFSKVMQLVERAYTVLGITDYSYRLSLRDPADTKKYVSNDAMWDQAEQVLREAMNELGLPYVEAPGEAAFYGPKLDIQLANVMGREETVSTIQIDFHLPNQFDLKYITQSGCEQRPVIIHRGIISTMERMTAYLIELYAGAFPVWLAPVQAIFIPIADRHVEYVHQAVDRLLESDFRIEVDDRNERMNAKIRDAQMQKIPYMLVVGDREVKDKAISVRLRNGDSLGVMPLEKFEDLLRRVNEDRSLSLSLDEN